MIIGINAQKLYHSQDYRNAGISRYIGQLLHHLAPRMKHRFVVFANEQLRYWEGWGAVHMALHASMWPTSQPAVRVLWEQLVLPWLAWRHRLDVLHCPLNIRPLATTVPCVLTIHDLSFERFPDRFHPAKQRYLAAFTRLSARRAAHILTDSASTRDDVTRFYGIPPERMTVVYPGVDADFTPIRDPQVLADFRRRHGLEAPYILYLGTLEPRKNVDRLVRAFAALVAGRRAELPAPPGAGRWQGLGLPGHFSRYRKGGCGGSRGYTWLRTQSGAAPLVQCPPTCSSTRPSTRASAFRCWKRWLAVCRSSRRKPRRCRRWSVAAGCLVPPSDEAALTAAMARLLSRPEEAATLGTAGTAQATQFHLGPDRGGLPRGLRTPRSGGTTTMTRLLGPVMTMSSGTAPATASAAPRLDTPAACLRAAHRRRCLGQPRLRALLLGALRLALGATGRQ